MKDDVCEMSCVRWVVWEMFVWVRWEMSCVRWGGNGGGDGGGGGAGGEEEEKAAGKNM